MTRLRRHSIAAVALAAIISALACALLPGPPAVRLPFALALMFVLPGFAVWSALFPEGREDPVRTATFSVGLSVVLAIIGGVELGASGSYSPESSAALMAGITVCAALIAHRRRSALPVSSARPAGSPRPRVRIGAIAAGVAALALTGVAIGVALTPLPVPEDRGYTEFSVGPTVARGTSIPLRIASNEAHTRRFRLDLRVPGRAPEARIVTVEPGQTIEEDVLVPEATDGAVLASLIDENASGGTPYRRLRIGLPVQGPAPPVSDPGR